MLKGFSVTSISYCVLFDHKNMTQKAENKFIDAILAIPEVTEINTWFLTVGEIYVDVKMPHDADAIKKQIAKIVGKYAR